MPLVLLGRSPLPYRLFLLVFLFLIVPCPPCRIAQNLIGLRQALERFLLCLVTRMAVWMIFYRLPPEGRFDIGLRGILTHTKNLIRVH